MPGNPGAVVVKRRREQEDKKHAKEERERAEKREKESRELKENIKLMQKRQIEKQFEEEMLQERRKKTNKNNGFFEFERKDFLLAIYFFDLAEEWEMKKLAFENLKIEIQEKLNTIQKPSDTIESITLALINFNSIKKILLSIIKNQLSYCTNERYGSFTISEHSFQFLIDEQKVDIFSYIKKLEERKNALLSLIEKSKIDMESLLFLDHFENLHESDDLEKLKAKKYQAEDFLDQYREINNYIPVINSDNFTNLEEFAKKTGGKIKILTLTNQAKTYKNHLDSPNLYKGIFNKNARRVAEIENCFSSYQKTLSELEELGAKLSDSESTIQKTRDYIERIKQFKKFLIDQPLNATKEKIKAEKIDSESYGIIEKIILDLIKSDDITEIYLSASEESHLHLQSSIQEWMESLIERRFHCACFFQSKTAALNTKNPALDSDRFLSWIKGETNPLACNQSRTFVQMVA